MVLSPAQKQFGAALRRLSLREAVSKSRKTNHCHFSDSGPGQDSLALLLLCNVFLGVGIDFSVNLVLS